MRSVPTSGRHYPAGPVAAWMPHPAIFHGTGKGRPSDAAGRCCLGAGPLSRVPRRGGVRDEQPPGDVASSPKIFARPELASISARTGTCPGQPDQAERPGGGGQARPPGRPGGRASPSHWIMPWPRCTLRPGRGYTRGVLSLACGARTEKLSAVTRADLDLEEGVLSVVRSGLVRNTGKLKTIKSTDAWRCPRWLSPRSRRTSWPRPGCAAAAQLRVDRVRRRDLHREDQPADGAQRASGHRERLPPRCCGIV